MSLKFLCFYQSRSVGVSLDALGGVLEGLGGPRGAPRGPGGHGFNRLWVLQEVSGCYFLTYGGTSGASFYVFTLFSQCFEIFDVI